MSKKTNPNRRMMRSQPHTPSLDVSLSDQKLTVLSPHRAPYIEAGVHSACWVNGELYFVVQSGDKTDGLLKKIVLSTSLSGSWASSIVVLAETWFGQEFAAVQIWREEPLLITERNKILRQSLIQPQKTGDSVAAAWSSSSPTLAIADQNGIGIWRPGMQTIEIQHSWDFIDGSRRRDSCKVMWAPDGQTLLALREHLPRMSYEQMKAASQEEIEQRLEARMTDIAVLQITPRRELLHTETLPRLKLIEWQDNETYRTWQHLPGRYNDAYLRRLVHVRNGVLEEENDEVMEAEDLRLMQEWMGSQGAS